MDKNQELLEEYRVLKSEILLRIEQRLQMLGFTIASVGVTLGFLLRESDGVNVDRVPEVAFIGFFILGLLNASIIHGRQNRKKVGQLGRYIMEKLEPKLGMNWEKWFREDYKKQDTGRYTKLPVRIEIESLAFSYLFMTVAVCLVITQKFSSLGFSTEYLFYYCITGIGAISAIWFSIDLALKRNTPIEQEQDIQTPMGKSEERVNTKSSSSSL